MVFKFGVLAAFGAMLAAAPSQAAPSVAFTSGTATPLTVGTGANAVTFTSAVPGTFSVANTGFFSGIGAALGDYGSFSGDTLTVTFASPVTGSLALPFGVEDLYGADTLTVATNTGYTTTATTTLDSLSEPEGTILVNAVGYTSLTITSANPYAIGGVTSVTSVPEPFTLSIMAVGLAGIAAVRRRRS